MKTARVAAFVTLLPAVAAADEVLLKGGGRVVGLVVERTSRAIVLETAPGRVAVPLSRVLSVREGATELGTFHERAAALRADDAAGWTALARWAADHGLLTQSREAWSRLLALDPDHPEANHAAGRVLSGGRWLDEEEANRARGLVRFDGAWVTPGERQAALEERAAEAAESRAIREAEARAREAEARAREAEARAAAAERDAEPVEEPLGGIPLWGPWGPVLVPPLVPFPPDPLPPPPPPAVRPPVPRPPTSSLGTPPARTRPRGAAARVAPPRE